MMSHFAITADEVNKILAQAKFLTRDVDGQRYEAEKWSQVFAKFGSQNGPKTIPNGAKRCKTAQKLLETVRKRCKTMRKRFWDDLREHRESLAGGGGRCA